MLGVAPTFEARGKGRRTGASPPNGTPPGPKAPRHPPPGGPKPKIPCCPECGKGRHPTKHCSQNYPQLQEAAMRAGKTGKGRCAGRGKGQ